MPDFDLSQLLKIAGVNLVSKGASQVFSGMHFDSRHIQPGNGFLARKGQNENGHAYIQDAVGRGATLVVLQNPIKLSESVTMIQHEEPYFVLQQLAQKIRQETKRLVIGVTGSVGKTSTKECLRALLGEKAYASYGNYNNLTGLPISILNSPSGSGYLVLEMGISEVGEMDALAAIACPDLMVITGVFSSHRSQFSSYDDLVREKLSCLKHLRQNGCVFLPPELMPALTKLWPGVKAVVLKNDLQEDLTLETKLGKGPYQSYLIAKQVAQFLGISNQEMICRQKDITMAPLRMQRVDAAGKQWILDCYNSSPQSLTAFFESLKHEVPGVMVLADMKELGEDSDAAHDKALEQLKNLEGWEVLILGDCFHKALNKISEHSGWHKVSSKAEVKQWIAHNNPEKIALKGSRFYALETLCYTN
jgi:UDP-N-acetylmuramoyl-tripeptide--D-alanyl-D-alanine ligase